MPSLREYAKLSRIHAAAAPGIVPVMGALAMGSVRLITPLEFVILFFIGVFSYIYGVAMNEVKDLAIDKTSDSLSDKPLVKGTISPKGAWGLSLLGLVCMFFLTLLYFPNPVTLTILAVSAFWGAVYNFTSKKIVGADIFMGFWAGGLCLFGAAAISPKITPLASIISIAWVLRLLYSNSVAGGLKDLESDQKARGKTIPLALGVRVRNARARYPPRFRIYEYGQEIIFLLLMSIPFLFGWLALSPVTVGVLAFLALIFLSSMARLSSKIYDREKVKKMAVGHELSSFAMMAVLLAGVSGWVFPTLTLALPLLWLIVMIGIVHKGKMPAV